MMPINLVKEGASSRQAEHQIENLILGRWSPRAMTGESISDETLHSLFEAARWAPSSHNNQPWRFIYAKRETEDWNRLFNLMVEFNKGWAKNAAALVVVVSAKETDKGQPIATHSYDTGAAWMSLALEGAARNLVIHGMSGFDYKAAAKELNISDKYQVEAMLAIGIRADVDEEKPNTRKPISEFIFKGKMH